MEKEIPLNYYKREEFAEAIDRTTLQGGGTNTAAALRNVKLDFLQSINYMKPKVHPVIVVQLTFPEGLFQALRRPF